MQEDLFGQHPNPERQSWIAYPGEKTESYVFQIYERGVSDVETHPDNHCQSVYLCASPDPERHSSTEAMKAFQDSVPASIKVLVRAMKKSKPNLASARMIFRTISEKMSKSIIWKDSIPWGIHAMLVFRTKYDVFCAVVGDMTIFMKDRAGWYDVLEDITKSRKDSKKRCYSLGTLGYATRSKEIDVRPYRFSVAPESDIIIANSDGSRALDSALSLYDDPPMRVTQAGHDDAVVGIIDQSSTILSHMSPHDFGFYTNVNLPHIQTGREVLAQMPLRHDWFKSHFPEAFLMSVPSIT